MFQADTLVHKRRVGLPVTKTRKTRSPVPEVLPSLPGQSLMLKYLNEIIAILGWWMVVIAIGTLALMEWMRYWFNSPPTPKVMSTLAVVVVVVAFLKTYRKWRSLEPILQGMRGERWVGQQLETLRRVGYQIIHDIEQPQGNIDHVLIGPAGVFTIETKTYSKPKCGDCRVTYNGQTILLNGHAPDRNPLAQANAEAQALRSLLFDLTGEDTTVQPVVLYEGWFVEIQGEPQGVRVRNTKYLLKELQNRAKTAALNDAAIHRLTKALERHLVQERTN